MILIMIMIIIIAILIFYFLPVKISLQFNYLNDNHLKNFSFFYYYDIIKKSCNCCNKLKVTVIKTM